MCASSEYLPILVSFKFNYFTFFFSFSNIPSEFSSPLKHNFNKYLMLQLFPIQHVCRCRNKMSCIYHLLHFSVLLPFPLTYLFFHLLSGFPQGIFQVTSYVCHGLCTEINIMQYILHYFAATQVKQYQKLLCSERDWTFYLSEKSSLVPDQAYIYFLKRVFSHRAHSFPQI